VGRIAKIIEVIDATLSNSARCLALVVKYNQTEHTAIVAHPAGLDSKPITKHNAITIKKSDGGNKPIAVGYNNNQGSKVNIGEAQLYCENEALERIAIVYAKQDGSIELKNDNGTFTLQANGDVEISNNAVIQGDCTINGISFLNHTHSYTDTPVGPSVTQPPQ